MATDCLVLTTGVRSQKNYHNNSALMNLINATLKLRRKS